MPRARDRLGCHRQRHRRLSSVPSSPRAGQGRPRGHRRRADESAAPRLQLPGQPGHSGAGLLPAPACPTRAGTAPCGRNHRPRPPDGPFRGRGLEEAGDSGTSRALASASCPAWRRPASCEPEGHAPQPAGHLVTSSAAVIRALTFCVRRSRRPGPAARARDQHQPGLRRQPYEYAVGQSPLRQAVDLLAASGVVVVVSAGNDGAKHDPRRTRAKTSGHHGLHRRARPTVWRFHPRWDRRIREVLDAFGKR